MKLSHSCCKIKCGIDHGVLTFANVRNISTISSFNDNFCPWIEFGPCYVMSMPGEVNGERFFSHYIAILVYVMCEKYIFVAVITLHHNM